ncbi:hypothetical protein C7W93_04585 [Glaciimonas sp. PCH181]|nr:hypothetical protein C7W93_04585 [Glaciimonas sp. PCH181]
MISNPIHPRKAQRFPVLKMRRAAGRGTFLLRDATNCNTPRQNGPQFPRIYSSRCSRYMACLEGKPYPSLRKIDNQVNQASPQD